MLKGADSEDFGIKHVQNLPISYARRSTNLHREYENYAWKVNKDAETIGIEDYRMSAVHYGITTLVAAGSMFDPKERNVPSLKFL
jgi:hypothetical protein